MLSVTMVDRNMAGPVWVPSEPPSLENFLAPTLQPIPLIPAIALVLAVLYLVGAARLWRARRRWPVWQARTSWAGPGLRARSGPRGRSMACENILMAVDAFRDHG